MFHVKPRFLNRHRQRGFAPGASRLKFPIITSFTGACLGAALFLTACSRHRHAGSDAIVFGNVAPAEWSPLQPLELVPDSAALVLHMGKEARPVVVVRYSLTTPVETLPLEVLEESFSGRERRDTIMLRLFTPGGRPAGTGRYGVYELCDTLSGRRISEGWRLTLTPLSSVMGIHAAGVALI